MKSRHNDIEIPADSPFKNCKLGRKQYAETLTKLLGNYNEGFVLAINSKWGTGKTTFVKMWEKQLQLEDYKTLYFNAWSNDFEPNPLISIISEFDSIAKTSSKGTFKKLVKSGAIIAKNVMPQLLKAFLSRYINSDIALNLTENISKSATEIFEDEIDNYAKKKEGLAEFKKCLTNFINENTDEKPLVFFIDELDRCRPNYAVELLEQIKHLFLVPKIVFILSIDKEQLGNAVRGVYGSDRIDADEYLRRFIDLEYSIPEPKTRDFCNYLFSYFNFDQFFYLEDRKRNEFRHDQETFINISSILFHKANLSLRQQEKIFAHARIGLLLFKSNQYLLPDAYLILIFLKSYHSAFYLTIQNKTISPETFLVEFEKIIPKGIEKDKIRSFVYVQALLVIMYNNSLEHEKIKLVHRDGDGKYFTNLVSKLDKDNKEVFNTILISIVDGRDVGDVSIDHLLKKIDLADAIYI